MRQKIKIELSNLIVSLLYLASSPTSLGKKFKYFFQYLRLILPINSFDGTYSIGRMVVKPVSKSSLRFLVSEIFLANEYFFRSKKSNPTIIDCGANIGLATIYFKELNPNAIIYAFEPDENSYLALEENIRLNNLDVKSIRLGLSDSERDAQLSVDSDKASIINSLHRPNSGQTVKIRLVTLSKFMIDNAIREVDLLKVDIEGEEIALFSDLAKNNALKHIHEIYVEYHHNIPERKESIGDFIATLEKNGYSIQVRSSLYPVGMKHRFQDIMIHAYRE